MTTVTINEKPIQCAPLTSLASLLTANGITADGKAVAINGKAIPPSLWAETIVTEGDNILVFRAFYGG